MATSTDVPKDARITQVACLAATKSEGRCRQPALSNKGYCHTHDGAGALPIKQFRLLLKAKVNDKWAKKLEDAGAWWVDRDDAAVRQRHAKHAQKHRRAFLRYRPTGDSGTSIFHWASTEDPKRTGQGVPWVSVEGLWDELSREGYALTDAHLFKRPRDSHVTVAVFEFTNDAPPVAVEFRKITDVAQELLEDAVWGAAHVWANPPWRLTEGQEAASDEQEVLIDTVNLVLRHPLDQNPLCRYQLYFMGGSWLAHEVQP